jgi:phytoene synthase
MADESYTDLPRPFYNNWSRSLRPAAHALWAWHSALASAPAMGGNETEASVETFYQDERERAEAGEPMRLVRESVWTEAYAVCDEHGLDRALLGAQAEAARHLHGRTQFETASTLDRFVHMWAVPHGRLLAGLAGADFSTQVACADELARGFFYLGRLLRLPADIKQRRLFIPMEDVRQADVSIQQLREGAVDESVQRLLWKQSVRARDAFAQGQPLIADLGLRQRYALKRWWLGALEVLSELERRDYDLWSEPVRLSWYRRFQIYLHSLFGRATTR